MRGVLRLTLILAVTAGPLLSDMGQARAGEEGKNEGGGSRFYSSRAGVVAGHTRPASRGRVHGGNTPPRRTHMAAHHGGG